MKKILLILLFVPCLGYSQQADTLPYQSPPKFYLTLGGGVALPQEKFKSERVVKNGFFLAIGAHLDLSKNVGGFVKYIHQETPFDKNANSVFSPYLDGSWKFNKAQLGLKALLVPFSQTTVECYFAGAVAFVSVPDIGNPGTDIKIHYGDFTYCELVGGIALRQAISNKFGIYLNAEYNSGTARIELINIRSNGTLDPDHFWKTQVVNHIIVGAGIVISL